MASDQKTFVFDEVAKHNKADDCWLIISGKVRCFFLSDSNRTNPHSFCGSWFYYFVIEILIDNFEILYLVKFNVSGNSKFK
ncbi:putative cytochrome b5-like heme/steroid binding domain superfamily [Helianthus anomalus]